MELYKIANKTWVKVLGEVQTPPGSRDIAIGDILFFDHIDGMYSYCTDKEDNVLHLASWADVEPVDKNYEN